MKLEDALAEAKRSLEWQRADDPCPTMECDKELCRCLQCDTNRLILAVEAHLRADEEKRNIYRKAFGLEPTHKHGGD